jgi:hypothetical protein
MKYIWILKYVLYCTFSKRNMVAAYHEGGAFGCLLAFPFISFFLIFGGYNIAFLYLIALLIFTFEIVITWNYDKVIDKYHQFDLSRWKIEKELKIVRWAIFIDILMLIFSIIYRIAIRNQWF